ncbi:MAG: hypothetical protein R2856_05365 [Caldilineaceae bacterium]
MSLRRLLLWLGLLALALIALAWWLPPYFSNEVPLGPQQHVRTINPKMGVHTPHR